MLEKMRRIVKSSKFLTKAYGNDYDQGSYCREPGAIRREVSDSHNKISEEMWKDLQIGLVML